MDEPVGVGVVSAVAAPDALDALVVPGRATAYRVADDELLLVCDRDVVDEVTRDVETRLTVSDPDAVVFDTSDGWAGVVLDGEDAELVFARLSRVPLPAAGFIQCEVAHVPAKVLVEEGRIRVLVGSSLEDHLRSRIAAASGDGR